MAVTIDNLKELVFASPLPNVSRKIKAMEREGKLRKLANKLYTTNLLDSPENIVRRNLIDIIAQRYPNAVISHRSAREMRPTETGNFFLTGPSTRRVVDLPGVTLNFQKGPAAAASDISFMGLHIASEERALLENLQESRKTGPESRILPVSEVEKKLEGIVLYGGEEALNRFRDRLRETSLALGMTKEFERANGIISALLSTHDPKVLSSESARAVAAGQPFDTTRVQLFEVLFDAVKDAYFPNRRNKDTDEESFRMFSFFESYFSNYIEGTVFEIDEAKQIVDSGIPVPRRDQDSHDVIGTFKLASNRQEMSRTPSSVEELLSLLRHRHSVLLQGRPQMNPGVFKTANNRAGQTEFVDYRLVTGTLRQGYKFYSALRDPFAKAIFMMFLISEVHPFTDGNGRMARLMMNAEFVRAGQTRIIVPTVFREDYILALRKLTRHSDPSVFIAVMEKLHRFSDRLHGSNFEEIRDYLKKCNAYAEPEEAKLIIAER